MVDKHFEKIASGFLKILKTKNKKYILMTHAPPYDTRLDKLFDEGHCGNKSVRNFIKKSKPLVAFSGHIHENNGKKDKLGRTRLINPGPEGTIVSI